MSRDDDPEPAYHRVANDLRELIARGVYPVGSRLPSTAQLMEIYNRSITSVRAAIKELQVEGLVVGQPGRGVYVQRVPVITRNLSDRVAELEETVVRLEARLSALESPS